MTTSAKEIGILSTKIEMFEKNQDEMKSDIKEIKAMIEHLSIRFASKRVETAVQWTIVIMLTALIYALVKLVVI